MSKPTNLVKDRWNRKNYDSILLRVPKGQKNDIQTHASAMGESLNFFIIRAIEQAMKNDAK